MTARNGVEGSPATGPILVTGGFGLVGSATVKRLAELGHTVVVADLPTPANRSAAASLPAGVSVRWVDLTDDEQTRHLVADTAAAVIIHLAAIIPPLIYRQRRLARRVNVDATAGLIWGAGLSRGQGEAAAVTVATAAASVAR